MIVVRPIADNLGGEVLNMNRLFVTAPLVLIASSPIAYSQQLTASSTCDARTTPAYGALVLRKADTESELQRMLARVTQTHPDVRLKRIELDVLGREMKRMEMAAQADLAKLTSTYGKSILRQVEVEVELETLSSQLSERHPDLINKKAELDILKREIDKVLR